MRPRSTVQCTVVVASSLVVAAAAASFAQEGKPQEEKRWDIGPTGALSEEEFKQIHTLRIDQAPTRGKMLEISGSRAYLSLPENARPPLPGIVVIHEWWGLNNNIKRWCDRLAADGYAALAVDLYGGREATTPDSAMQFVRTVNEEAAFRILHAAHRFLADDMRVLARRRACIGWCFGGGWSLQQALTVPDLDAAVIYYGRLVTDPDRLRVIKAPILGIFANQDRSIPPEAVDAFDKALTTAGVEHRILRYDADHAFANPSGARYDHKSAGAAWEEVRAFLANRLKASQ